MKNGAVKEVPPIEDQCQTTGCENDIFVDDYGVTLCESCLDARPDIEAYLRRQRNKEASQ